jgi:GNAT superfamily N-acetyltransferase
MNKDLDLDPSKIFLRGIISSDYEATKEFHCSNGSMELFLSTDAFISHISREASTTLVFYENELIAYFTLHHEKIKSETPFENFDSNALSLDRLAVSSKFQSKGVGTYLMKRIKDIAYMTNEMYIQAYAVFDKWQWYQDLGFRYFFEDDINEKKTNGLVYMIFELLDEKAIEEYCDV